MSTEVREIELTRTDAQAQMALGEALERLQSNRDFKLLINEAYLRNEAIRLVHAKSDPATQDPDKQAAIIRDIDGIGCLLAFLRNTRQLAEMAGRAIENADRELQLIEEEEQNSEAE